MGTSLQDAAHSKTHNTALLLSQRKINAKMTTKLGLKLGLDYTGFIFHRVTLTTTDE